MILLLTIGCLNQNSEVMLSGQVRASQYESSPAAGVQVSSFGPQLGFHSKTETDEEGEFEVAVVSSSVFHVVFEGEGITPTSFSGIAGGSDFSLDDDHFFVRSDAEVDALRSLHSDCENIDGDGGIVDGLVQFPITSGATDDYLIAENIRVLASTDDSVEYSACYLDDDGESLERGDRVGASGRFAIFGVREGVVNLEFQQIIGNKTLSNYAFVYMVTNGAAPLFPVFIDLPQ